MKLTVAIVSFCVVASAQTGFNRAEAEYNKVEYLQRTGRKVQKIDGSIELNGTTKALSFIAKGIPILTVPFDKVSNTIYEFTATPRYAAGILLMWPLLFTKSTKHFMTIQYEDGAGEPQYAIMHLDKSNAHEIVNAVKWVTKREAPPRPSALPPPILTEYPAKAAAAPAFPLATFTSDPPGAEVRVDGEYAGTTPTAAVRQKEGVHRVSMRLAGYADWKGDLQAKPGETVALHAELGTAPVDPNKPKISGLQ